MVGTVHRDPSGFQRLSRVFEEERPAIVTVEVSPYGLDLRTRESAAWRALLRENLKRVGREGNRSVREIILHPAIQGIFSFLREPYEWRAAAAYKAGRKGVLVKAIDLSCYSRGKLADIAELVGIENIRILLGTPSCELTREIESAYRRANSLFRHPPSARTVTEETKRREAHIAGIVGGFIRRAGDRKVAYVGGWEHLVETPDSVYGRLKDLRPKRILLGQTGIR